MQEEVKTYEIGYLLTDATAQEGLIKLLVQHGGEVSHQGELKEIKLAYPIQKRQTAHFGFAQFKMAPEGVAKYKAALKLQKDVLRTMILSFVPKVAKPTRSQFIKERPVSTVDTKPVEKLETAKPLATATLSNEALEKKLEEILK